jgi:hypothetical protein
MMRELHKREQVTVSGSLLVPTAYRFPLTAYAFV